MTMFLHDRGVKALTSAIVLMAVRDWYDCARIVREPPAKLTTNTDKREMLAHPSEQLGMIEAFFRSDWFVMLCDMDGETMLETMRANPQFGRKAKAKRGQGCEKQRTQLRNTMRRHEITMLEVSRAMGLPYGELRRRVLEGCTRKEAEEIRRVLAEIINGR